MKKSVLEPCEYKDQDLYQIFEDYKQTGKEINYDLVLKMTNTIISNKKKNLELLENLLPDPKQRDSVERYLYRLSDTKFNYVRQLNQITEELDKISEFVSTHFKILVDERE